MRRIGPALAVVALLGTGVYAHHSHPDFLTGQDATVEGTIEGIEFKNPHVLITLRAADSTVYAIEWQGAGYLHANVQMVSPVEGPVESDTLSPGDRIVVVGCPSRDPSHHELVILKRVQRPLDGWLWTCRRPNKRMTC